MCYVLKKCFPMSKLGVFRCISKYIWVQIPPGTNLNHYVTELYLYSGPVKNVISFFSIFAAY